MYKLYTAKKHDLRKFLKTFFLSFIIIAWLLGSAPRVKADQADDEAYNCRLLDQVFYDSAYYWQNGEPPVYNYSIADCVNIRIPLKYYHQFTGVFYPINLTFRFMVYSTIASKTTFMRVYPAGNSSIDVGWWGINHNGTHYKIGCRANGNDDGTSSGYLNYTTWYSGRLLGMNNYTSYTTESNFTVYADGDLLGTVICEEAYSHAQAGKQWLDSMNLTLYRWGPSAWNSQNVSLYIWAGPIDWLNTYFVFGMGTFGIFLMMAVPSWIAWGYKKQGFEVALERIMVGLVLEIVGFGLMWAWLVYT